MWPFPGPNRGSMYASLFDQSYARVRHLLAIERKRALSAPSATSRDAMVCRRCRDGRRAPGGPFLARQRHPNPIPIPSKTLMDGHLGPANAHPASSKEGRDNLQSPSKTRLDGDSGSRDDQKCTVRSRYKRIVYKRIWVASLPFQSVWASFSSY